MDFLDVFDGSKNFSVIKVPLESARAQKKLTDMSMFDDHLNSTIGSSMTGTEYAQEYIKEEEEKILADERALLVIPSASGQDFEAISESTAGPAHHDLQNENLTKIYNTYDFAHRAKEGLTISSMENKIVSIIETNSVTVIQGPTGCGKTTQVPQFILDSCVKKRVHCNIIVTQPRRIAAISIAKRVSEERNWPVGSLVGYKVGMVNNTSLDTRLTYCTTGVLLHRLISMKNMLDYTHVIIDEVHERDQDMDFVLLMVRKFLRTNSRSVKVILMSATFSVDKFSTYFSIPMSCKLVPAPVIDVAKRNFFNIQVHYICQIMQLGRIPEVSEENPKVSRDMMTFCINLLTCFDQMDNQSDADHRFAVLIFLPGIWEIEEMHALLTSKEHENLRCDVVILHSFITSDEQQNIFNPPPAGQRRIILATNIAESSITIPDIKYVIDFCLTKQMVTDPKTNFQCLEISWASKANCEQRAGRAGRLMDGRVYRLVPLRFYEEVLPEEGQPEMLRAPLENVVLNAKMLDMGEPKAILALSLDPPDLSNLERTILVLKEAGALLDKENELKPLDGILTDLGRAMGALPLNIHITKLIMLGHIFSVLRPAIIIGASMAVKNVFSAPFQQKLRAYAAKLTWSENSSSDCISFLNAYNTWIYRKATNRLKSDAIEKRWARSYHLQIRVLREIEALVREITLRLRKLGIIETVGNDRSCWSKDELPLILKIVIAGAFYPNYYTRSNTIDESEGVKCLGGCDPTKTVYLQGWPIDQPGLLYARRIQEYFQDCVSSKITKILVSFDKSCRVYVQFRENEEVGDIDDDNTNQEPGEISMCVYKAIKLRSITSALEVPVMNAEAAAKRAEQLGLSNFTPQVFLPKEGPIETIPQIDMKFRPILPALDIAHIRIDILRPITPGHFWAYNQDEVTLHTYQKIRSMANSPKVHSSEGLLKATPEIGSMVLVPRSNGESVEYCRGVVRNVTVEVKSGSLAEVLLIDTGYMERVPVYDLRKLDDDHEINSIPGLAFECVLAGIRPSEISRFPNKWSTNALILFEKLLKRKVPFFGEIYSVVDGIVRLKLIYGVEGEQIVWNDQLIELGFAEAKEEDYQSRCNHGLRERYSDLSVEQRQYYEKLQYTSGFINDSYPEPPDFGECHTRVKLRGPFSPLEINLTSLAKAGISKRVVIDNTSINSVLLDANPDDPHDRLLVAGFVGQSPAGYHLTLRNTTLMPNIPGLTSLLCLIFAPRIELRRNRMNTRYIGALCGLGYHPLTKNSLFPDHDLPIHFDVDISMDDLQEVNRLRYWMNLGIHVDQEQNETTENNGETVVCQARIKRALLALLSKRKAVPRETDPNFGAWCRYDERCFLPPGKVEMSKHSIYRLHEALELEPKDDERENMISHIEELRQLSGRHYRDDQVGDVVCKLCDVSLWGVYQLRIHLCSKEHIDKEKTFMNKDDS
ncbi:probable ATP-dependent RNA helicase spindle-E [Venturia canescens]|uniref:probable ATP-dependent RNA helicase spindle-E n=1 Tax=Venturia canescens TaxID=32260 RepID=UPI001C9C4AD8|nr:probable ATP-dependent RNA helicase spindle-E [Venturia canescens]